MPIPNERLYERQAATLLASWRAYSRHSDGAFVRDAEGAGIAVFPSPPERAVYNNALLSPGLCPERRSAAIEAMEDAYREAGVERYAAWAHEAEPELIAELSARGYRLDTSTRAMAMALDRLPERPEGLELASMDWDEYARRFLLPGLLVGADAAEFHLRVASLDGEPVGAVIAYDHEGDCGVYNLGTLPVARRRGIGTALTLLALHEARERGCATASLQATTVAERLYAWLGFRDLGRYLEHVPADVDFRAARSSS
jgi:ribosomal protein S18 acetylase RimI-like enzyme